MKTLQDIYDAIPVVPLMTYDRDKAIIVDRKNDCVAISLIGTDKENTYTVSRQFKTESGENYFEFRFRHLKPFLNKYILCRWKNDFYDIFIDDNLIVWASNDGFQTSKNISLCIDGVDFSEIYLIDNG